MIAVAFPSTANVSRFQLPPQRRITMHECFGAGDCVYTSASGGSHNLQATDGSTCCPSSTRMFWRGRSSMGESRKPANRYSAAYWELNREPRMEMTKCPISIAAAFLVLPPHLLPRASWVFLLFPGG